MIRLPKIVRVRVALTEPKADWCAVRCLDGRAKWLPESHILSLNADVVDDEAHDKWLDFFAAKPAIFQMEVEYRTETSREKVSTCCFSNCRELTLEFSSATVRPNGPSTTRYYLKAIAEQPCAAANPAIAPWLQPPRPAGRVGELGSFAEKGVIVIRRYKRGEESVVWNVYFAATRESIARDYHPDLIDRWAPHNQDLSQWADRLAQKNPFVAIVDEEIVGMAEIEPNGFIDYFYVHPGWQSRGIGKALLVTLESEATKLGVSVIWADVSVTAKAFFLSSGFRVTEAKSNIILGHPAPNFRMQKTLSSEQDGAANPAPPGG